jgi:type I restriction enzyme S subunit
MSEHGWTYKRLGEVCVDKKQIVRASNLFLPNEIINYIDISSIDNSQNVITSTTPIIFDDAPSRAQQVVKIGDVLISLVRPNLRNVAIVNSQNDNLVASSGFCILRTEGHVNNRYIFYIVKGDKFTNYLLSRVQGANYPAVREDDIKNYLLPVPPMAEQERIVAELDLLQGIIEKKKEQLKAYDQLAQSIFYTMFGDPVTNEKGWDIKKLGDIGKIITGNTPSTRDERNYDSDDVCFFKPSDIAKDGISLLGESEFHVSSFAYNNSRKLPKGSVLVTCIGIVGKVGILEIDAMCNQQINAIIPNEDVTSVYVAYSVLSERKIIESIAHAPVVPIINKGEFSQLCIPLPPLHLQQEFAEKVEAIERQKALVQQSIEETQTMFDYTMDKYFG